jgi:uncharacterized protein (TIGR00661 family)
MREQKKILFTISSLGLGHATRTLAVINHFKDRYDMTIISYANTLEFLKKELGVENAKFISFEDYPKLERGEGFWFYYYLVTDLIKTNFIIKKERQKVQEIEDQFDFIFSDGRYGFYSKKIPSFLLSHQIAFIPPLGLAPFMFLSDIGNYFYFKKFNKLFIPDFKNYEHSLAGKLSHPRFLRFLNHQFVGLLSSYKKMDLKEDIDYLFVISGYLQEHKDKFISNLLQQAKELDGKKVFVLGNAKNDEIVEMDEFDITIYPSVESDFRQELLNRAKVVISRTGYTTIMDLVELDKKAILFATPNQSEQEYLAKFNGFQNYFVIGKNENNFNLKELISKLPETKKFPTIKKTKETLCAIENTIKSYFHKNYFSIVIPAYNEEKYLEQTLQKLSRIDYDAFEVIVVENGSNDSTFEIAKNFTENMDNLRVFKSDKGVCKAKNLGANKCDKKSDWTIFLDADTILDKDFLKELNNYINKKSPANLSIGTCGISPLNSNSFYEKAWFKFYDFAHMLTKTSYSIQIAKSSIAKLVKFDEELNYSEDIKFIRDIETFGNFFFMDTKEVFTSTRRFRKEGYFKTFFTWNVQALTPRSLKIQKKYSSVR